MVSKTLEGAKILEPKYRSLAESQDLSDILTAFTTTRVVHHREANNQEPSPKIPRGSMVLEYLPTLTPKVI